MNNKKRFDISSVLSLVIMSILPIIVIILGFVKIADGILVTGSIVFTYFILPIIVILLLALTIFKAKKLWVKVTLGIVIPITFLLSLLFLGAFQSYEFLNHYENDDVQMHYAENINELMPRLSELSNPQKVDYYHYEGEGFIFFWQSDSLICKYSDEEYLKQKTSLEKQYVFQTAVIKLDEHICEPTIEIDGYSFRMLSRNEYEMDYPKDVVFIATNDETREIVYICYNDQDRDYIESVEEFILDECGWKHIR